MITRLASAFVPLLELFPLDQVLMSRETDARVPLVSAMPGEGARGTNGGAKCSDRKLWKPVLQTTPNVGLF